MITHQPYPSDVSDAEWEFVVPYLCLLPEDAAQREHGLRDVFDALRWIVRSGSPWRYLPKDFPPWEAVYQQTRRWLAAGCFEAIVHDLRAVLRLPPAACPSRRPRSSTAAPCSPRPRAGPGGLRRPQATQGLEGPPGRRYARAPAGPGRHAGQRAGPGPGRRPGRGGAGGDRGVGRGGLRRSGLHRRGRGRRRGQHGIHLVVVSLPEAKQGFVLLPRRWVVERSFGWMARFRRLARDYERLGETLEGLHYVAFSILMLHKAAPLFQWSS